MTGRPAAVDSLLAERSAESLSLGIDGALVESMGVDSLATAEFAESDLRQDLRHWNVTERLDEIPKRSIPTLMIYNPVSERFAIIGEPHECPQCHRMAVVLFVPLDGAWLACARCEPR